MITNGNLHWKNIRHNNAWCRKCDIINRSNSIEDAQILAKKRGGECLSTEYINADLHLKWKCKKRSYMGNSIQSSE